MLRNSISETGETNVSAIAARRTLGRDRDNTAAQQAPEDAPEYLFDLLVAARRLAVTRRHRFLAYLIGMAAEEARLLTQGRSAVKSTNQTAS